MNFEKQLKAYKDKIAIIYNYYKESEKQLFKEGKSLHRIGGMKISILFICYSCLILNKV